jgi:low temperature requirement protein LtrA
MSTSKQGQQTLCRISRTILTVVNREQSKSFTQQFSSWTKIQNVWWLLSSLFDGISMELALLEAHKKTLHSEG